MHIADLHTVYIINLVFRIFSTYDVNTYIVYHMYVFQAEYNKINKWISSDNPTY